MEIDGKIILDLGMQSGTSKAGRDWKKKEYVLETFGSFPKKVKFHIFGDKADTINLEVGNSYTLSVDLESRDFNDRWYTDVSCYAARPYAPGAPQQPGYPQPGGYPQQPMGYPQPGGYPQQPAAYPQQPTGYPQQPVAQPGFDANAFPPAPTTPGGFDGGDSSDDLPF